MNAPKAYLLQAASDVAEQLAMRAPCDSLPRVVAGGMVEIFLFIIASGLIAHFIGAGVHEGIFVGALVRTAAEPLAWLPANTYQCFKTSC